MSVADVALVLLVVSVECFGDLWIPWMLRSARRSWRRARRTPH